jgi:hypothetical protein
MNLSTMILTGIVMTVGLVIVGTATNNFVLLAGVDAQLNDNRTATIVQQSMASRQNITGTINLNSLISNALASTINVSLSQAVDTAEQSVGNNSHALAGFLGKNQGYIVYTIYVISDPDANRAISDPDANLDKVIVDPGNGQVLLQTTVTSGPTSMMLDASLTKGSGAGLTGKHVSPSALYP